MVRGVSQCVLRELAARRDGGIDVRLVWRPADAAVFVVVTDAQAREQFAIRADPTRALDVYMHPYSYAQRSDVEMIEVAA